MLISICWKLGPSIRIILIFSIPAHYRQLFCRLGSTSCCLLLLFLHLILWPRLILLGSFLGRELVDIYRTFRCRIFCLSRFWISRILQMPRNQLFSRFCIKRHMSWQTSWGSNHWEPKDSVLLRKLQLCSFHSCKVFHCRAIEWWSYR